MATLPLFKNSEILNETPSREDYVGVGREKAEVINRIKQQIKSGRSGILAYIGPFGSGKSTVLDILKDEYKTQYEWIDFELWRHSNRREIWDAFVIKVSSYLNNLNEIDIADEIEGVRFPVSVRKKFLLTLGLGLALWVSFSYILWLLVKNSDRALFVTAFLKYSFPVFLTFVALLGFSAIATRLSGKYKDRPLRRVFELENKLDESLKSRMDKPVIIIAEDVDRTTKDGEAFLETLKIFIDKKTANYEHPIIVIAPQSLSSFTLVKSVKSDSFERALKIYDGHIYSQNVLNAAKVKSLISKLEPNNTNLEKFSRVADILFSDSKVSSQVSLRLLKNVLRDVEYFISANKTAEPTLAFVIILSRYVHYDYDGTTSGMAQWFLTNNQAHMSKVAGPFFRALLIASNHSQEIAYRFMLDFKDLDEQEIAVDFNEQNANRIEVKIDLDLKYKILTNPYI